MLDADRLRQIEPDQVLSWLYCSVYDVYDVAQLLVTAGFRGVYKALARDLPNPGAVKREIRRAFPGLAFELVCPAELSQGARDYHAFVAGAGAARALAPV